MNNHVPLQSTCQRMKELGYPQNGDLYYWHANKGDQYYLRRMTRTMEEYSKLMDFAAPLASEILEQLPEIVVPPKDQRTYRLEIVKEKNSYLLDYVLRLVDITYFLHQERTETLADSAGRYWIYLKEKGLI